MQSSRSVNCYVAAHSALEVISREMINIEPISRIQILNGYRSCRPFWKRFAPEKVLSRRIDNEPKLAFTNISDELGLNSSQNAR